jgi:hypothetical protein
MPPPPKGDSKTKKKKGHAPAHQNKFAFRHNPKSKLTEKIVSSPNIHVCRRCYDKIKWRKQYRKYKPRTQPGFCNGCQRRNVLSAYHTICTTCTTESVKAQDVITREQQRLILPDRGDTNELMDQRHVHRVSTVADETSMNRTAISHPTPTILRACAVCVKEIALSGEGDQEEEEELATAMSRIRLRELKTLERKAAKRTKPASAKLQSPLDDDDYSSNSNQSDNDHVHGHTSARIDDKDVDDDDPFLKAIGGASQLLTGEAYQDKLLRQQMEQH